MPIMQTPNTRRDREFVTGRQRFRRIEQTAWQVCATSFCQGIFKAEIPSRSLLDIFPN